MEVFVDRPKKLYRYSERRWLERALLHGDFRLRPASHYLEIESATARRDDERNRVSVQKKGTFVMTLARTGEVIETLGDITHTSSIDRDYYTLCFSSVWDPRNFKEFEGSDACLIIHDPADVMERIHAELERQYPDWVSLDAPVSYGVKNNLGVVFTKPVEHAFQAEHRLALIPSEPRRLAPLVVTIGSIEGVAEIVDETYDVAAI